MSLDLDRYAGLHWSIPKDTPLDEREWTHFVAAESAWRARERELNRPVVLLRDPQNARLYLRWRNGSRTWESEISIAFRNLAVREIDPHV
jgi:hypothetical protein